MRSKSLRKLLFFPLVTISTLAPTPEAVAANGLSEPYKLTDADFAILPALCRAKITQSKNREVQEQWIRRYGSSWGGMHHYCYGLKALNLAYRDFKDSAKRSYFSTLAVKEIDYVLENAEPGFPLRPEMLIQRGRALTLARSYEDAKQSFEEALKTDPKSVDAWVALSDLYGQMGKNAEAKKVLEQALEVTGTAHKKITARLDDMNSKSTR